MKRSFAPNLYVALTHYPVVNKNGETIASAVTNLDLHDISRLAITFGVRSFYVVTPLEDQKALINRIVSHWQKGAGALYNPKRREALALVRVMDSLREVIGDISNCEQRSVKTVATCARNDGERLSFSALRNKLKSGDPYLLIFGTAWGLSAQAMADADYVLEPISGPSDYNHLSVRAAAAIILDRLVRLES